jgi:hypothetical protein
MGVNIVTGSATTYIKKNPSFAMITVDQHYMVPLDMDTHFFNITKANNIPTAAKWELLHNFLNEYGLRKMSPAEIFNKIAERLMEDETRAKQYLWNKYKQASVK